MTEIFLHVSQTPSCRKILLLLLLLLLLLF
jgi:hypothetical protein